MRIIRPADRAFKHFATYHYLKSTQLHKLMFSRGSPTYAQATLKELVDQGRLTKLGLRDSRIGNPTGVWMSRVPKSREPYDVNYLEHALAVTDSLMAFAFLEEEGVELLQLVHDQDLKRHKIALDGIVELGLPNGKMGIALEVDMGSEHEKFWKGKIQRLLAFADEGYKQYGLVSLTVAVVVPPGWRRVDELLRWTETELKAHGIEEWGPLFWFTGANPARIIPPRWEPAHDRELTVQEFFGGLRWRNPFDETPKPLIGGGE